MWGNISETEFWGITSVLAAFVGSFLGAISRYDISISHDVDIGTYLDIFGLAAIIFTMMILWTYSYKKRSS
jgi:hypothetical protein